MRKLLKNGLVVTEKESVTADVLIDGEKISKIEENLPVTPDIQVIDVNGKWILWIKTQAGGF